MTPIAIVLVLVGVAAPASPTTLPLHRATNVDRVVSTALAIRDGYNDRAFWFRLLFDATLSPDELACVDDGTVLHEATRRCEWLFEQGPCAPREWLVLEGGGLRAACRPRPCAPGYGFLADEGRCAPQQQLCAGQAQRVFRYSLRGDGRCHCKGFRAQGPDGACHLLFHRGPCPLGQILVPIYTSSLHSLMGTCVRSACGEDFIPELSEDKVVECRPKSSLDCAPMFLPLLDTLTGLDVPVCDYSKRNSIRPTAHQQSCVRDNRGVCTTGVVIRSLKPFDWNVGQTDGDDDRISFVDRRAASYLRRYLSRYALFSLLPI